MTRNVRVKESNCKRACRKLLRGFILEKADESNNDGSVQSEVDSFKDAYANLLPLDLFGQPYLEFVSGRRRLM